MYDIIVVGAGPAGLTAAIYARRAEKKVLVIEKSTFGGQITHSPRVENYPGFAVMSGVEFADKLVEQTLGNGADIELDTVTGIEGSAGDFTVKTEGGEYKAKAVIIAAGSHHRTLGIEREHEFTGEGISYCAVCDGAFYKGKDVVVIGGGNSALQEAVMLSDICKSVTVVQNLDFFTGEKSLVEDLEKRDNVKFILSATVDSIIADSEFKGITLNTKDGKTDLYCDGMFVAIGQVPENEPFENAVKLDGRGYIVSGEDCLPQSEQGIFVAGDCRTKAVRQITTATADGAVAALAACRLIDNIK
jgi:thioredoxin reductase (NADPH)